MKNPIRNTVSALAAFTVIVGSGLSVASAAWAQQKERPLKDQLVGSWKILTDKMQIEGQQQWKEPLGANPKGYVIFTAGGRYMQLLTGSGRRPATGDAERTGLLNSMSAFSGKYVVDNDQLVIMVDTSWSEAHQGDRQKQVRLINLDGNKLTLRTPLQVGGRTVTLGGNFRTVTEYVMEREE